MPFGSRLPALLTVCCSLLAASVWAAEPAPYWPTFRGPQRTGVSPDKGLLQKWPESGPQLVWDSAGVGRGYSSLAIAGGRIFTMGDGSSTADDKDEYLFAFELDGKPLWKTKTGNAWNEGKPDWQSSRSTPTVDGALVYILTPHGDLVCCESASGNVVWRKNLKTDFEGKKDDQWGYSESVTIDGDRLICTPGGEKNSMVALDKKTGSLVWQMAQPGNRGAGHASIVFSEIGGARVYVQTTGSGAIGVRASDGKLLWNYDIDKTTAVIPTAIVRGDLVYMAVGYKRGAALLKQVPSGDGEVKVEEVYGLKPELANKHGGVVLVGDYVYGDSDDAGMPYCADLMTGENKWEKKRGTGKGSAAITAADGLLYVCYADGTVTLANVTAERFEEISTFKVPGAGERPSWAHPVIAGGKLYLREQDHILCYDLRASAN